MNGQDKCGIPRVIHYVWFGKNPKSKSVKKCIASWHRHCHGYKIIEWNESNYDVRKNRYMYEAYKAKKWAFASDYARYDIIYRHGGVYLDTDVELVANMNKLLDNLMFMCFLEDRRVASGLGFGSMKGNPIIKEILQYYEGRSFYKADGRMDLRVCNHNETDVLARHGLERTGKEQWLDFAHIYPREYMNPAGSPAGKTIAVNHFDGSWDNFAQKAKRQKNIFLNKIPMKGVSDFLVCLTDTVWDACCK